MLLHSSTLLFYRFQFSCYNNARAVAVDASSSSAAVAITAARVAGVEVITTIMRIIMNWNNNCAAANRQRYHHALDLCSSWRAQERKMVRASSNKLLLNNFKLLLSV